MVVAALSLPESASLARFDLVPTGPVIGVAAVAGKDEEGGVETGPCS